MRSDFCAAFRTVNDNNDAKKSVLKSHAKHEVFNTAHSTHRKPHNGLISRLGGWGQLEEFSFFAATHCQSKKSKFNLKKRTSHAKNKHRMQYVTICWVKAVEGNSSSSATHRRLSPELTASAECQSLKRQPTTILGHIGRPCTGAPRPRQLPCQTLGTPPVRPGFSAA